MKRLALLLSLLVSASAFADADLVFASLATDKTEVRTGERFRLTGQVTNAGPDPAYEVRVTFNQESRGSFLDVTAPGGWTCTAALFRNSVQCSTGVMNPGAEAQFALTTLAPPAIATRHAISAFASSSTRDPNPANSARNANVVVIAGTTSAILFVDAPSQVQVANGAEGTYRATVYNGGPNDVRDVAVVFHGAVNATASGDGWTCSSTADIVVCRRDVFAANTSSTIDLRFRAPQADTVFSIAHEAFAELNQNARHQITVTSVFVGSQENWRMMLVPLFASNVPGANNSLWNTELRMFIDSETTVEVRPHDCEFSVIPECYPSDPPLRKEFDPRAQNRLFGENYISFGQFVYVRAADFDKVKMNARIWDLSRQLETAGAEIPIPRDDQFTSGIIDLLNIPVAPHYRHTLRVYDTDGRTGTRVVIRIYANAETEPRLTTERQLFARENMRLTTALLPSHPATLQLELGQLMALEGIDTVRVEVQAADPGARLWSFVSITNNETHHVTTVTPQ